MSFLKKCGLAASMSLVVAAGVPAVSGASSAPTASSILAVASKAVAAVKYVHIHAVSITGKTDATLTADIGPKVGTESYLSGDQSFTLAITKKDFYVKGSASALEDIFGLTKAEDKRAGTKWISWPASSSTYTQFEADLTVSQLSGLLPAAKGTTLLSKRDKKTGGYRLSWSLKKTKSQPATSTIMVMSPKSPYLPISEVVTESSGTSTTTYSKWNQKISVSTPTDTVAYNVVFKS